MQKFYTDKPKLFECNISVDGAKISETKARLILEFPNNRNLLFYGKIDGSGKCEVNVPALKELNECEGTVLLEIIAESTHFESWRDNFKLEANKKVQVEVISPKENIIVEAKATPRIEILTESVEEINNKKVMGVFNKYIDENNLNINSVIKDKTKFFNMLYEYKANTNATKEDIKIILENLKKVGKSNQIQDLINS